MQSLVHSEDKDLSGNFSVKHTQSRTLMPTRLFFLSCVGWLCGGTFSLQTPLLFSSWSPKFGLIQAHLTSATVDCGFAAIAYATTSASADSPCNEWWQH